MIASAVQFAVVAILLGIGSVMDIRTREIPNWISVAVLCMAALNFNLENLWGVIVAVIFFSVALATGKIGGGDVKRKQMPQAFALVAGFERGLRTLEQAEAAPRLRAAPFRTDCYAHFLCGELYFLQN